MTRKQRKLMAAIRDGVPLEEAAAIAGYTRDYARRLLNEPAMAKLEDRPKPADVGEKPREPTDVLLEIIRDDQIDERTRIAAIRALTAIKPVVLDNVADFFRITGKLYTIPYKPPEECTECVWHKAVMEYWDAIKATLGLEK